MKGPGHLLEEVKEPWSYDAVQDGEIVALGIFLGRCCQDSHDDLILRVSFGQIRWNHSFPDEMPEVIRMQMNGRFTGCHNQASRCGAFSSARWARQNEDAS